MRTRSDKHRTGLARRLSWTVAAGLVAGALLIPAASVSANNLHQSPPIKWDASGYTDSCKGVDLGDGQVLWHFIHTGTDGEDLPSTITATFSSAGQQVVAGYSNGGGNAVVMYDVVTGRDTLTGASDSISNDGLLNLSHICVGPDASEEPSSTPSDEASEEPSSTPSDEASEEPSSTPSDEASEEPSSTPSDEASEEPSSTPSDGGVDAATGTPSITLPPTDTIGGAPNGPTGMSGLSIALLSLASLIAVALVATPASRRLAAIRRKVDRR